MAKKILVANDDSQKDVLTSQLASVGAGFGDTFIVKTYDELTKTQKKKIIGEPPFEKSPVVEQ
jgi:hypothetical protein